MSPQNWIGKTIGGRYQIESLLGQGGMSAVYRAYDPNLRRPVAIKLIHPHLSDDPNFVGRFKEEAAAVARLRHPNIVQVHDFDIDGETYFMVMEYLVGETLQTRLRRLNQTGRYMAFSELVHIGAQISQAASYAHDHEIIHRDIKPANIMLDVHNQAILMDFGIVKIIGGEYHTSTGATIGTAMYMSPEQIRGERADDRSDIYSLGVTLYEMISGRPPYQADSAVTLMMMVLNDPLPDLRTLRDGVPSDILSIVHKALDKEKSKRYQTMAALTAALDRVQANPELSLPEKTIVEDEKEGEDSSAQTLSQELPAREEVTEMVKETPPPVFEPKETSTALESLTPEETDTPQVVKESESAQPAAVMPELPASRVKNNLGKALRRYYLPIFASLFIIAVLFFGYQYFFSKRLPSLHLAAITNAHVPLNATTAQNIVSLGVWETDSYVVSLSFSPDGAALATANNRDWLRTTGYRYYAGLWQLNPPELQTYLMGQEQWVGDVAFSPDARLIATASEDGSISLWEAQTGTLERSINDSLGNITAVAFSPDSQLLAASTSDGYVGLWQVSNANLLRTMQEQDFGFTDVDFSPDGYSLAGASDLGEIMVWNVSDASLLMTLEGHTAAVTRLAFSPDGSLLASASEDHSIRLWKLSGGSSDNLLGHSETVTDLAFSPDGTLLSSGSEDGTLRLWQVADHQMLYMLSEDEPILSIDFSPNGDYLVSGEANGVIHFWGISDVIPVEPTLMQTPP